jgi:hypothetical protein
MLFFLNTSFLKKTNITIHFTGYLKKFNRLIIDLIKKNININLIKISNLTPQTQCRPRKLKK